MARTTVRITALGNGHATIDWVLPDGGVEFTFNTADLSPSLQRAVLCYGIKQIIADGGAVGRDVPDGERIAKMSKRADALVRGTWGFRDGHGTPAAIPDWQIAFEALVAVGALPDVDHIREAFRARKPAERLAMLKTRPDALREYNERKTPTNIDGTDLLASLAAKA
jgi:hypothetical protein